MSIRDLVSWHGRKKELAPQREHDPFYGLQREINRVFDRFFDGFDLFPSHFGEFGERESTFTPRIDIKEGKKDIKISAEMPGMDEKDIDVTLSDDSLVIKGEKKREIEDNKNGYYRMERSYGSFYRTIPLPDGIDKETAEASFKKGVLKITIPKTAKAIDSQKKIEIKT
ncbi:MAG: Hsp20/alpha crystallin family protein [bacterium]